MPNNVIFKHKNMDDITKFLEGQDITKSYQTVSDKNWNDVTIEQLLLAYKEQLKNNVDLASVRLSLPDDKIKMLIKEVFASWGENGVSFGLSEDEAKELQKYLIDNKLGGYES